MIRWCDGQRQWQRTQQRRLFVVLLKGGQHAAVVRGRGTDQWWRCYRVARRFVVVVWTIVVVVIRGRTVRCGMQLMFVVMLVKGR